MSNNNTLFRFDSDDELEAWLSAFAFDDETRLLVLDHLSPACIGVTDQEPYRLVYSKQHIVKVLMEREGFDADEAHDFMEHNILGIDKGEYTPVFIDVPAVK